MRSKAYIFAAILLAASLAQAATPALDKAIPAYGAAERAKATPIAITGPATLEVGQEGLYRLSGTPAVDLSKPLLDQLAWALGEGRMFVYLLAPGQPAAPLEVRLELVIAAGGATLQPVIHVTPLVAGEHRILVDWNFEQDQLAEFLITVGGGPEPEPDPIPPPTPGKRFVLVVSESGERNGAMGAALVNFRQWLVSSGHEWRIEDPDLKDKSNKAPAWFQAYLDQIKSAGVPLPALVVGVPSADGKGDTTIVSITPMPDSVEKAIEAVKAAGG